MRPDLRWLVERLQVSTLAVFGFRIHYICHKCFQIAQITQVAQIAPSAISAFQLLMDNCGDPEMLSVGFFENLSDQHKSFCPQIHTDQKRICVSRSCGVQSSSFSLSSLRLRSFAGELPSVKFKHPLPQVIPTIIAFLVAYVCA